MKLSPLRNIQIAFLNPTNETSIERIDCSCPKFRFLISELKIIINEIKMD